MAIILNAGTPSDSIWSLALKNENNKIMDYYMDRIYGKNNKELEIVDTDFQCITYYE